MTKKLLKTIAVVILLCTIALFATACQSKFDGHNGFIKAQGRILVDEDGKEYNIEAINFGNEAMDYPAELTNGKYGEETYKELSEMGLNSVRFLINYNLFEDDANPYVYKESGFAWIDKNLEMAKKYGIRLILDMHTPQGGYQSWDRENHAIEGMDEGDALWVNPENQKRLAALWGAIAERYADEPGILGYGVVNEPMVAISDFADSDDKTVKYKAAVDLYQGLLNQITASVRAVDTNHILFVQNLYAIKDLNNDTENWVSVNDDKNFILVDDTNVVYEFHFYGPNKYTHQGGKGSNSTDYAYGDEDALVAISPTYKSQATTKRADPTSQEWQYVESGLLKFNNETWNVLGVGFTATALGEGGVAYIDNLILKEYDENGNYVRDVYYDYFEWEEWEGFYFWDPGKTGKVEVTEDEFYEGEESLSISNTKGEGSVTKYAFKPKQGYCYQVGAYIKVKTNNPAANVTARVLAGSCASVTPLTRETLESGINAYVPFSEKYNVPIFCGEYGCTVRCFYKNGMGVNRGGAKWVSDVIDILIENNIGSAYHMYAGGQGYYGGATGSDFGMYQTYDTVKVGNDELNEQLYKVLSEKFADPEEDK